MEGQKTAEEIAKEILAKSNRKNSAKRIQVARFVFFLMAGFQALSIYLTMRSIDLPLPYYSLDIGLCILFLVLFVVSFKYPFPAFIVGLSAFVGLHLFIAIFVPDSLMRGFVYKIAIMTALVLGVVYSWNLRSSIQTTHQDDLLDGELDSLS